MTVQFKILCGKKAGSVWTARRFPVRIGRSANADLQLDEDGVWDEHSSIDFRPVEGFVLRVAPDALATLNDNPVREALLSNGDTLSLGSVQLQFWLGETGQPIKSLRLRSLTEITVFCQRADASCRVGKLCR